MSAAVERLAQRYAAQLVAAAPPPPEAEAAAGQTAQPAAFVEVAPESLQFVQPRSVGVEHAALSAMQALGFETLLASLGINGIMRTAIIASIVARMAAPGSELASHRWITGTSALGELLDADLSGLPLWRLYKVSDVLLEHQEAIEQALFGSVQSLFGFPATVTLYDLTNTYFEGGQRANEKAQRGHSKEQRTDCPLLTLGLVCDESGFIRRSRVFAGNAVEWRTLADMLAGLGAPAGALVVMDRGIATAANLGWLAEQGYRYLVMSRESARHFDFEHAESINTSDGSPVSLQRELSEDETEVRLYCHSPARELKERAMDERFCKRFEAGLSRLAAGLTSARAERSKALIDERIGRLKASCRGAAQHYTVTVDTDASATQVTAIRWEKTPRPNSRVTHPGVYCLRSNDLTWDAERMWRTYVMLTDLEAVFRSLKSELGLRPIYHSKQARSDGHLFISVLAYQFVQVLRTRLKAQGIHTSWSGLRDILSVQRRVTATFAQRDGRTLHVRKSTQPEPDLLCLYKALDIAPLPGGTKKLVM
ncbi:MAG: IS1634 family transposase [Rhodocyclaceae bacterium]|nr:IS1634 family transposase [Rhodocyclaceae bacterium]